MSIKLGWKCSKCGDIQMFVVPAFFEDKPLCPKCVRETWGFWRMWEDVYRGLL